MMNCRNVKKQINNYTEGILTESVCKNLEAHLEGCPECAAEWRKTQKLFHFLNSIPDVKAPVYFEAQLNQRLAEQSFSFKDWIADSFGFLSNRRFQLATISACFMVVISLVVLTVENPFQGDIAEAPQKGDTDFISDETHRELAGIGYVIEDGAIEFSTNDGTGSVIYEFADTDSSPAAGQGIQPVSIVEINF
jgi:hypothetical protein